jgi:hypothetical protein
MTTAVLDPTTEQAVALADRYAGEFVAALDASLSGQVLATRSSLHKAVSGTLLAYLIEVLAMEVPDERHAELVSAEAG